MAKNQCLIELQKLKDSVLTNGTLSSIEAYDLADLINRRQPRRVRAEWGQEKKAEMREFLEGLEEIFTKLAVTCEGKNDEQVNKRQLELSQRTVLGLGLKRYSHLILLDY